MLEWEQHVHSTCTAAETEFIRCELSARLLQTNLLISAAMKMLLKPDISANINCYMSCALKETGSETVKSHIKARKTQPSGSDLPQAHTEP